MTVIMGTLPDGIGHVELCGSAGEDCEAVQMAVLAGSGLCGNNDTRLNWLLQHAAVSLLLLFLNRINSRSIGAGACVHAACSDHPSSLGRPGAGPDINSTHEVWRIWVINIAR